MIQDIDVSVVIVSYNTSHIIHNAIDSVLSQQNLNFEVIIIDNNSPDNSRDVLEQYRTKVSLVYNKDNIGAGQAVNQGYRMARGRICYLLNPDAVLQSTTALRELVDFVDAHPEYGLVGTRVLEDNGATDVLPKKQYPYQQHISSCFDDLPGDLAWVLGASTAMPKKIFEQTGGYAKEFFLYGDEVDFCMRLRKLGYQVGYAKHVVVKHIGGGSEHNTHAYAYWVKKQGGLHNFILNHYSANDIEKILRIDSFRSKYRSVLLGLLKKVFKLTPKQQEKLDRYKAIYDTSQRMLNDKRYLAAPRVNISPI